jgi:hypothetical protein
VSPVTGSKLRSYGYDVSAIATGRGDAALAIVLVIVRLTARRRHRSASIDVTPVSTQWLTEHRAEGRDRFSS